MNSALRKLIKKIVREEYEERPTVPAWASDFQKEVDKDLAGKNTGGPNKRPPTQMEIKVELIRKSLREMGYGQTRDQMRAITHMLPGFVKDYNPVDLLVKSGDELAKEFAEEFLE